MGCTVKCPTCAVNDAIKKHLEKEKGWRVTLTCKVCKGTGQVPDAPARVETRRKDMSGIEWLEADRKDEWEYYKTHEEKA